MRRLAGVDPSRFERIMHAGGSQDALLLGLLDAAKPGSHVLGNACHRTERAPRATTPACTGPIPRSDTDTTSWDNEKGSRQEEDQCV